MTTLFLMVHISDITSDDIVEHAGVTETVTQCDIKHDSFMGISLFGDTYHLGNKKVKKIIKALT